MKVINSASLPLDLDATPTQNQSGQPHSRSLVKRVVMGGGTITARAVAVHVHKTTEMVTQRSTGSNQTQ